MTPEETSKPTPPTDQLLPAPTSNIYVPQSPVPGNILSQTPAEPVQTESTLVQQASPIQTNVQAAPFNTMETAPPVAQVYAQPMTTESVPVTTPVVAGANAALPFYPAVGQSPISEKPKRSKIKMVATGVGVLFGLLILTGVGYGAYSRFTNLPITYTKADLVTTKAASYSFKNPKQWVDYTNDKSTLKTIRDSLGSSGDSVKDQKILAYKYDSKTDIGRTVLFTGKSSLGIGISDEELRTGLKVATTKKSFEDGFSSITTDLSGGSKCASTSGNKITFDYPNTGLVVLIKADVECIYDAKTQAKSHSKSDHTSVIFEIKDGNGYLGAIISAGDDWSKNASFYQDDVLASLMPN